ncbi:MAG: FmdB family zinc ribbon protein [Candidatus Aminicenantales bacterium]
MPIYEYKCQRCGAIFEILQRLNDEPAKRCIKCGGRVRKLISPPTLQFKGEGWYVTDYAKKTEKKESKVGEKPQKEKKTEKD